MLQDERKARFTLAAGLAFLIYAYPIGASVAQDDVGGAEERFASPNTFGGIGLLQTRTARFGPDGLFHFGYSRMDPHKHVYLNVHIFPWLEAAWRYTEFTNQLYSPFPTFSGYQSLKDRGADLKLRLLKEGLYLPAVAVGLQDGGGTGKFAGEYVVASKHFGDFDFSLGIGWGHLGSKGTIDNPLIKISERFRARGGGAGTGGTPDFGSFFAGETVGLFGGFEYRTPIEGLTFKFEYDGHDYVDLPNTTQYSFGVNFRPYPWIDISVGRGLGGVNMMRFSLRAELHDEGIPKFDPPPHQVEERPKLADLAPTPPLAPAQIRTQTRVVPQSVSRSSRTGLEMAEAVFEALERNGLMLESFHLVGQEATVGVAQLAAAPDVGAAAVAVLGALPVDVLAATIVPNFSTPTGAVRSTRAEEALPAPADALFKGLVELGLDVEAVEIDGDRGTVLVKSTERSQSIPFAAAAHLAATVLSVREVSVQDARTGATETWLAFGDRPPPPPEATLRFGLPPVDPPYTEKQRLAIAKRMSDALEPSEFYLETLHLEERSVTVALTALRFQSITRNLGFATRIIVNHLPAPIEEITVVLLSGGMEASRTTFLRSDIEREAARLGSPDEVFIGAKIEPGLPGWPDYRYRVPGRYPRMEAYLAPNVRQHIGSPEQFFLYQFWLAGTVSVDLMRGLSLTGTVGRNLYHNFDRIRLESDSVLPHVRSDIKHYLQKGGQKGTISNIVRLQSDFSFKLSDSTYGRMSAGLFEEMFGGVSAELLYRPFNSRLSFGMEMNRVRRRTFEQKFDFFQYEVDTGFASVYFEEPWYNALVSLHLGRYLAGDKGGTLEISRRFDSGVRVGAWMTLTDVPFETFGEGSFDKGFFIVIPYGVLLGKSSTSWGAFAYRPLFRDGGQRLVLQNGLYDVTSPATIDAVTRDWPRVFK